jgi:hypothetical protein
VPYHDVVVADEDLLDDEPYDALSLSHIERIGGNAQPREKRGECFCKTQEIGAIIGLICNRLRFGAQCLFALP